VFVTTEKDAIKIRNFEMFRERPVFYLKIGLRIEEAFEERVLSHLLRTKSNSGKDSQ
jgi:tetraacyldisaccharide-1-P 4'-kinase